MVCSNGNGYDFPCAYGTANNPYDDYTYGGYYQYHDLCGVNLVDDGYGNTYKGDYKGHGGYAYHGKYAG